MTDTTAPLYDATALVAFADALLQRAGLAPAMAASVAQTLVDGDLLGHDTHGLALLAGYLKEIENGGMTASGTPRDAVGPPPPPCCGTAGACPAPGWCTRAWTCCCRAHAHFGTATLAIRRSHHIACLAVYMLRALDEGMLMLLACSDPNAASVAPYGGTQAVFTPNPAGAGLSLERRWRDGGHLGLDHHQRHEQPQARPLANASRSRC